MSTMPVATRTYAPDPANREMLTVQAMRQIGEQAIKDLQAARKGRQRYYDDMVTLLADEQQRTDDMVADIIESIEAQIKGAEEHASAFIARCAEQRTQAAAMLATFQPPAAEPPAAAPADPNVQAQGDELTEGMKAFFEKNRAANGG